MADWMSWLHMPKFTDDEFSKQKADYVAKHGYTITIPGLSDIIKIAVPKPMDSAEKLNWKRKDWGFFAPVRLEEIRRVKEKKKDRYLAMLASPTPAIVQNFGSIMCSMDDAQDAVSTLACIGSLARTVAPKIVSKALFGPVGVLWVAADLLNILMAAPYGCLTRGASKRTVEELVDNTPKKNNAWLRRAPRIKRALPRKADWIQAAQVSTSVFGFGISLGPIVGLAQDLLIGSLRHRLGQTVKVTLPMKGIKRFARTAYRAVKSLACNFAYPFMTEDEDVLTWLSAATLSYQLLHDDIQDWHPLDMIEDLQDLELKAPIPEDPLTLEIIEESGIPLEEACGWPQTGKLWSPIEEIADTTQWGATENLDRFVLANKHSFTGYWAAATALETSRFALATLESEAEVQRDYIPSAKMATKMLGAGLTPDPSEPLTTLRRFAGYMHECDRTGYNPTVKEIQSYCAGPAAIKLREYSKT